MASWPPRRTTMAGIAVSDAGAGVKASGVTLESAEPTDFLGWIESIRSELKPPVANKLMAAGQLKIMIVGGPNTREDYHIEEGEELFLMLKGDMCLDVIEKGKKRSIEIKEGEFFLLPGRVPHSPQRKADTVGLVIERERVAGEMDGLRWYVPGEEGSKVLYEEWFHCTDLGTQLKPVIERFFASDAYKSKEPAAGSEYPLLGSKETVEIDGNLAVGSPRTLESVYAELRAASKSQTGGACALLCGEGKGPGSEFVGEAHVGGDEGSPTEGAFRWQRRAVLGESWWYQTKGTVEVQVELVGGEGAKDAVGRVGKSMTVKEGGVLLLPKLPEGALVTARWAPGAEGIVVTCGVGM